jgi:hypothetical protein
MQHINECAHPYPQIRIKNRHPEAPACNAGLEGCGREAEAIALRGSLRSHLRVTQKMKARTSVDADTAR